MVNLLFPGRHIINTKFQKEYLEHVLGSPVRELDLLGSSKIDGQEKITNIIFAVTSANQENSRYNPIPFHIRAIEIDRFASELKEKFKVNYQIIGIPHYQPTKKFGDFILKEVRQQFSGEISPSNTIVLSSTPVVIDMYKDLGFAVLTAEYDPEKKSYNKKAPAEILHDIAQENKEDIFKSKAMEEVSDATKKVWQDFPEVPKKLIWLWRDPLLTEEGSLTEMRNYSTYAQSMASKDVLEMKFKDIEAAVVPGKIVDEGCADCALMTRLAKSFPDSDILGIEITGEFIARCKERQRAGEFGGTYTHFYQRNLEEDVFKENSIDTTICNSTTHEIWSYMDKEKSLLDYIERKFKQLRRGGRLVIRDVVGPENKDQEVYVWLSDTDGSNEDALKNFEEKEDLCNYLKGLSTYARFLRFSRDYLSGSKNSYKIEFSEKTQEGKRYVALRLKDAVEFITKKDYIDNWDSELNEEFAFWSFSEWKKALKDKGFSVIENPNSSRVYRNEWIVDNKYKGKVKLFSLGKDGVLEPIDYPVTNIVLIGEKKA